MNLPVLLGLYEQDFRLKQIAAGISLPQPLHHFSLQNIYGSAFAFISATVWKTSHCNHVFVLNDQESAAYFHNDFEQITDSIDVHYFPDSFKKTGNLLKLNESHLMLRTEALAKFSKTKDRDLHKKVLITYPEALIEKVIPADLLNAQAIAIKVGENLDVEQILKRFIELGFHKEDFVYQPGQFAIRGGILDIYSFGNEHPYRIELFGKEVDSIRLFNAETQLSEKRLLQVSILPNIENKKNTAEKISLLNYLPDNTVFWFENFGFCLDKMKLLLDKMPETLEIKEDEAIESELLLFQKTDFENVMDWKNKLITRHLLEWNSQTLATHFDTIKPEIIQFTTSEQPVFNRQFNLLINDLTLKHKEKYTSFIFAENSKQLERLQTIFTDLNAALNFVPIPIALSKGFVDEEKKIVCYTDHQIFQRYHKYKVKQAYTKGKAITLKALRDLQPGDYVSHIDHGVGRYSGLQKIEVNGNWQEAVRIIYKDNDVLYVNINSLHKISKFTGKEGTIPKIHKLGSDAWDKLKNKTKKQVKEIATDLIKLYAKRKAAPGFAHQPDTYLQTELEASFFYEDTPDQSKATADVKRDMEAPHPMDRLICGDVGFGKTEIAIRAAFKTVVESKQAAILVPTTILAYQHFQTFKERLKDFPCTVDYINRFKSAKEKKETFEKVKAGKIDILIGTHSILGKDIEFKNLGILIVDEEQKFGVAAKEKLREKKANVDTLTLTATPIPRTLQFSLLAARDLSIINTPPPNRQPVSTEIIFFDEHLIREALYYEVERGGQVYFIHNRVQSLPEMVKRLTEICPDLSIGMAHGQMEGHQLEAALFDFIGHKYDILCCTNIVESGVDIPNANTIFINNAHQFGLSDLHQLRGRVGRSNKKAFCYLVAPPISTLPDDSRKRLQTLEQFSELGSGFQIAMRDLDIRGAGDLLGGEQSGFISDIGFETYQKILDEAVRELKSTDFKELYADEQERNKDFVKDCTIDTDLEIIIPETYIENITERLSIYTQLDDLENESELKIFQEMLVDRFGPLPDQVTTLFTTIHCRRLAKELGFEKMIIKNEQMRLYFISNPESPYFESATFQHIMQFIQSKTLHARLKQTGKNFLLIVDRITKMDEVKTFLESLLIDLKLN